MVSVIIPTFNRSKFVAEAVTSVLAQQGVEFEVIVVDDGSDDATASVLAAFGNAIRSLFRPHGGVSSARNTGIRAATGEWIAFLDSDDLWLPQKLRRQLAFFSTNPAFKICQTEEIWIRNGLRVHPKSYHRKPQGDCFSRLLERCLVSPSAVVIHREVFQEVGLFDESLPACEDYDLWLRIGCRYPIGLVDELLTVKRGGHPDQLSNTIPALDRYRILALARLIQSEPLSTIQQKLALHALEQKCRIYLEGCIKRGRTAEAEVFRGLPTELARGLNVEWPRMDATQTLGDNQTDSVLKTESV